MADRAPILVFNDEGHHCWRPRQADAAESEGADDDESAALSREEQERLKEELVEARIWLAGLDRINNSGIAGAGTSGIVACVDLSATPFYLSGSGHPEGSPFPWLVADFGLVDAIECGIVKVPRMPVKDSLAGTDDAGRPDPEYFRLWDHVLEQFTPADYIKKRPKPDVLLAKSEPALTMLYSQWKERFDQVLAATREEKPIPPVMIVVCVSMLTEGWDASNVTHVFGLRPFRSQLLCEQVVGRGLRRMSYTPDPETGLLSAEYVDVYGIPFSLIPYKGRPKDEKESPDPVYHHIYAVPERSGFEIRIPVVEGYAYALRGEGIVCDVDSLPETFVDEDPEAVFVAAPKGYVDGQTRRDEREFIEQTRAEYYKTVRLQEIYFRIAQDIVRILQDGQEKSAVRVARHRLFPEVLSIVERYVETRVRFTDGVDHREVAHQKHVRRIQALLVEGIRPAAASADRPLVALLNRAFRTVSTASVNERTARPVIALEKSHINRAIVLSSFESAAIDLLERDPNVECFASNDKHLGLVIGYEYDGNEHQYIPDFVIRLAASSPAKERYLLLEIKGGGGNWHPNQVSAKSAAAMKWCAAVTNLGRYGEWHYEICHEVPRLPLVIATYAAGSVQSSLPSSAPMIEVPREQRREWENSMPLVALKMIAGSHGLQPGFDTLPGWAEYWVRPTENLLIQKGMFVAQVHGAAMEPLIPAGAWCVFKPAGRGNREGKTYLVRHSGIADPAMGGQYTVRKWYSSPAAPGGFARITLRGISPEALPIVLEPRRPEEVEVLAQWVRTLR